MNYNPLPAIPRITHAPKKSNHPIGRTVCPIKGMPGLYGLMFGRCVGPLWHLNIMCAVNSPIHTGETLSIRESNPSIIMDVLDDPG